jgi:hypothetical protein
MANDCVMDAYETYQFATQRLALKFECGRNWKQENWPWGTALNYAFRPIQRTG